MEGSEVERLHPPSASFSRQNIVPCSCRKKEMIGDAGTDVDAVLRAEFTGKMVGGFRV